MWLRFILKGLIPLVIILLIVMLLINAVFRPEYPFERILIDSLVIGIGITLYHVFWQIREVRKRGVQINISTLQPVYNERIECHVSPNFLEEQIKKDPLTSRMKVDLKDESLEMVTRPKSFFWGEKISIWIENGYLNIRSKSKSPFSFVDGGRNIDNVKYVLSLLK